MRGFIECCQTYGYGTSIFPFGVAMTVKCFCRLMLPLVIRGYYQRLVSSQLGSAYCLVHLLKQFEVSAFRKATYFLIE